MRLLGAGVLFAGVVCGQTYEIRGTVSEPGVGGIAGIALHVSRDTQTDPRLLGTDAEVAPLPIQVTTDTLGAFRISLDRPGVYYVAPDLNNGTYYPLFMASGIDGRFTLDAANPRAEVQFSVARSGQITGLVRDEETRQPIAEYPVVLYIRERLMQRYSVAMFIEEPVLTDRDGRFTMAQLRPGEYVVGTRLPPEKQNQSADAPGPKLDALDSAYAETFWPGGASDPDAALPVRLTSGGIVDMGDVLLHKVPLYKIGISIPQGECPPGESIRVTLLQSGAPGPIRPPSVLPCGGAGVMSGLAPGSYILYAVTDWQEEPKRIDRAVWAIAPFTIKDKDEDVTLVLRHGTLLEGHITVPEGTRAPDLHPFIEALPADWISLGRPGLEQFVEWTSNATFRMAVRSIPHVLDVTPAGWYVKEIRYNGAPVRNRTIPAGPEAAVQTIEIVMDNKVAQVSGTVLFETKPAGRVLVLFGKATPDSVERSPGVLGLPVEEHGQFSFQNVTPGDYLIKAVVYDRSLSLAPDVMERMLAGGEKITLAPGAPQNMTIRLTDIGR